jgi:hypothetical protein
MEVGDCVREDIKDELVRNYREAQCLEKKAKDAMESEEIAKALEKVLDEKPKDGSEDLCPPV